MDSNSMWRWFESTLVRFLGDVISPFALGTGFVLILLSSAPFLIRLMYLLLFSLCMSAQYSGSFCPPMFRVLLVCTFFVLDGVQNMYFFLLVSVPS